MLQEWMDRGCARLLYGIMSLSVGLIAGTVPRTAFPDEPKDERKIHLADKLKTLSKGNSSDEARKRGLAELPLDHLAEDDRKQAQGVLENLSVFRELPTLAFQVDPQVHEFFLDHPEIAVSIWRAMKISKFHLRKTGPGVYRATDNDGTQGRVEIFYRDRHQILAYCDGVVKSPLLPGAIQAKTLLHLQRDFVRSEDDSIWSRNRMRMYVAFPSQAIETTAKVIAPLGNLIIDRNLREVCLFVGMMSAAMVHQPGWVEHVARQLKGVPKKRQNDLIELTARVFVAARKRELSKRKSEEAITLEEIVRPLKTAKKPDETEEAEVTR